MCFAPLALHALVLAGRAEETARANGSLVPAAAGTARVIAYAGLALWLLGMAFEFVLATRR